MRTVFFALLSFLAASPLYAARVAGVVLDGSGAPIAGATVTAGAASVMTGDDGSFVLADAPDGAEMRVMAAGFAPASLDVGGDAESVRVVLQPAPLVDTVVVTASRGAARLATPEATTVVTSAELLTSAAGSLDDALRNTPGFSLFRRSSSRVSNPTTQGVTLRGVSGSGASRTLVLADGVPLNDPFGSWVYWNRVPQAAVDRVEIVRGAAGDLYGADALGGVVQVLTFAPGRTRVRATGEGGSHDTGKFSGFAGTQRGVWSVEGAGELVRTAGTVIVGEEVRGPVDIRADSDYASGFVGAGYNPGNWHGSARLGLYDEDRGNGTPITVNSTEWKQMSGEAGGSVVDGAWLVRASGGTQTYYQTFSAVVAPARAIERLTFEQTIPSRFATVSGQWTRGTATTVWLFGAEARRTRSTANEIRYSVTAIPSGPFVTGGTESSGALFARVSTTPLDRLTIVLGARGDFWQSSPRDAALPTHSAEFFSPRASAAWRFSPVTSVQASVYRAHRTPTLNELYRDFAVGNTLTRANSALDPERLTGVDGGVLFSWQRLSARLTGFLNQLDGAITNVTITPPPVPGQITRQRQNTDTVRAKGLEVEADYRPIPGWTLGALAAVTRSTFEDAPVQPALVGNRVPQVPSYQLGVSATYVDPRGFTGSLQARRVGLQFDDDLNTFELESFGVVDVSASQELIRGLNIFLAIENLFDTDYDVGRTPIRTVGWPRSARMGVRVFLP